LAFLGVPFDGGATLGWPGARYAPDEVRRNLAWMRMRVEEGRIYWIDRDEVVPFDPNSLQDEGDVAVVPHDLMATLAATRSRVADIAGAGKVPVVVGGDDSLLFPSVAGLHDALSGVVAVVHFDAHLDLTESNPRQGTHSQSSGMRRALELDRVDAHQCVQVGTRNFNFPSSKAFIDSVGLTEIPATRVLADGVPAAMATVDSVIGAADHLFVSVDIDVLDPAFAPGVGWQEPGGLTVRQLLDFLVALAPRADGLALNEVNPMTDHRSQTSIVAANLIFQFAVAAGLGNR
jgi:formiminoglutamase/agmatinase